MTHCNNLLFNLIGCCNINLSNWISSSSLVVSKNHQDHTTGVNFVLTYHAMPSHIGGAQVQSLTPIPLKHLGPLKGGWWWWGGGAGTKSHPFL